MSKLSSSKIWRIDKELEDKIIKLVIFEIERTGETQSKIGIVRKAVDKWLLEINQN